MEQHSVERAVQAHRIEGQGSGRAQGMPRGEPNQQRATVAMRLKAVAVALDEA